VSLTVIAFIPEALARIELNTSPSANQSGAPALISHHLRRGGKEFKFNIRAETDRFSNNYKSRFDTFSYGYQNYLLTADGKIFNDNLRFFAAGETELFDDYYRKFWSGFKIGGDEFPLETWSGDPTLEELTGTDVLDIQQGNIPNAGSERFTLNSIISADFSPLKLDLVIAHNLQKQEINITPILDMFSQDRVPESHKQASLISLQADFDFGKDIFAHLQTDAIRTSEKQVDPLLGDNYMLYLDSLALAEKGVTLSDIYSLDLNKFTFTKPGDLLADYQKMKESNFQLSGYLKKKFDKNSLTLGGSYKRGTYRGYNIGYMKGLIRSYEYYNNYLDESWQDIMQDGRVQAIGYDIAGNEINETGNFTERARRPVEYSAFIEDSYKTDDLQIKVGLRYDAFNTDALTFTNLYFPENAQFLSAFDTDKYTNYRKFLKEPILSMERAPTHTYLSPRLNVTFKPNKNLIVQFNYGKYLQQPRLQDVYASVGYFQHLFGWRVNDVHAFDAKPVQSIQSSFEISWRLKPELLLGFNIYQKLSTNYLQTILVEPDTTSFVQFYNKLDNTGESMAKGVEISLKYQKQKTLMFFSYALSNVSGYGTYPTSNLWDAYLGDTDDGQQSPLDYNQKHRGNAFFSYRFGKNINPLLRNIGLSLLFRFNSGHNFKLFGGSFGCGSFGDLLNDTSPRGRHAKTGRALTTPWFYTFDFKIDRQFRFLDLPINLFVYAQNLFNRKNTQHVYRRSGVANHDGLYDEFPGLREAHINGYYSEEFFVLYDLINGEHRQHYTAQQGGDLFGRPREIRFGFQIAFSK